VTDRLEELALVRLCLEVVEEERSVCDNNFYCVLSGVNVNGK